MKKLQNQLLQPLLLRKLISANKRMLRAGMQQTQLAFVLLLLLTGTSCISTKNLQLLKDLTAENEVLKDKLNLELSQNNETTKVKGLNKEIDSTTISRLTLFLDSAAKQAEQDLQQPDHLNAKEQIQFAGNLKKSLQLNLENVSILSALLKTNSLFRFNTGAIFKPGGYLIEDDLWKTAYKAFSPIMDSILNFTNRYQKKKFDVTIVILGYSDATPIGRSGSLFTLLTEKLKNPEADKSALNKQLSQMRAESVATVIDDLAAIKICKSNLSDKINLNIYSFGKGEELPDPLMKNVTEDDERRRSVVAYWNVMPKK